MNLVDVDKTVGLIWSFVDKIDKHTHDIIIRGRTINVDAARVEFTIYQVHPHMQVVGPVHCRIGFDGDIFLYFDYLNETRSYHLADPKAYRKIITILATWTTRHRI